MSGRPKFRTAACLVALLCAAAPALAQGEAPGGPQGGIHGAPSYEIVSRGNGALELRFHNMPMRSVHADDAQNALSVDFAAPVDGTVFDRLAGDLPDWIAMAYANYDTGVIRASRPVTYLTRQEGDGFALRIVPRGPPPPPPGPVALRGYDDAPPPRMEEPPPELRASGFNRDTFGGARNYYALQLALHRGDPALAAAYARADAEADSSVGIGSEWHQYKGGDTVVTSNAHGRIPLGGGASLIGSLDETDAHGSAVRQPDGSFAHVDRNIVSGSAGLSLDLWDDKEVHAGVLAGNGVVGAQIGMLGDGANGFWNADFTYHAPDLSTPDAVVNHADRDEADFGIHHHLGYGLWGGLGGHVTRYGVDGDDSVATTAGWNANLRWSANFNGLLAGIAYDGMGDYRIYSHSRAGAAPTPYVPLAIRDMEVHTGTASLSTNVWEQLWLDAYGGYAGDRYANEGGVYGAALSYRPTPGVDLSLGVRHSQVSYIQGETGAQTSAGLTFTLGFGGAPRSQYFSF